MPIVKPHEYADTPIFREMLEERQGRFPGTPQGSEPPEPPEEPEEPQGAVVTPDGPSDDDEGTKKPIPLSQALIPVQPVAESA
jgi:hypothetical protein